MRHRFSLWLGIFVAITLGTSVVTPGKDFTSDPMPPAPFQCPGDKVVWVNTRSHIYHFPGQTWFGHTKYGKYDCERAADAEGDRPTHNGQ